MHVSELATLTGSRGVFCSRGIIFGASFVREKCSEHGLLDALAPRFADSPRNEIESTIQWRRKTAPARPGHECRESKSTRRKELLNATQCHARYLDEG